MAQQGVDEYDFLVHPGFLRRSLARWNEDGSAAPTGRVRGAKGDQFTLTLTKEEVQEDFALIEGELGLSKSGKRKGGGGLLRQPSGPGS
mmetsp:Transcript_17344/g.56776  ORF Transcript_17344/g.56776 Transcript_17344/m.56776 type:complete len:89 (-) Transcript_17344:3370-3636(-)